MYKILLVDDDTINRVAIMGMTNWSKLGYEIIGNASNGEMGLEMIRNQHFDVVLTDMKMPIMDGVEMINEIRKFNKEVCIIAISSYSDFDLVRKAFKNKIEDYILKIEFTPEYLERYFTNLKIKLDKKQIINTEVNIIIDQKKKLEPEQFYTFVIQILRKPDAHKRVEYQKNIAINKVKDVLEQIPRVEKSCDIEEYTNMSLILYYKTEKITSNRIESFAKQMVMVVKNMTNIDVGISASDWCNESEFKKNYLTQALERLSFSNVYGTQSIFLSDICGNLNLVDLREKQKEYSSLLKSLTVYDDDKMFECQSQLFNDNLFLDTVILKKKCLELIYFQGVFLEEIGDSVWEIWGKRISFEEKVFRLNGSSSVVMWMANYNRWVMDYLKGRYQVEVEGSSLSSVCHYIEDNYSNPLLSLADVASIAGFNEKYFSTKFKKEMNMSFVEYLTDVRINAAKSLIKKTNMKLAQISESIGYNNVEHFIRVFKKQTGFSPREYQKKHKIDF